MTVLTSLGSSFVRCTLHPVWATTFCRVEQWRMYRDDGRDVPGCRACEREVAWANRQRGKTRDLKGRAA